MGPDLPARAIRYGRPAVQAAGRTPTPHSPADTAAARNRRAR